LFYDQRSALYLAKLDIGAGTLELTFEPFEGLWACRSNSQNYYTSNDKVLPGSFVYEVTSVQNSECLLLLPFCVRKD
jgi:hypothetical protein